MHKLGKAEFPRWRRFMVVGFIILPCCGLVQGSVESKFRLAPDSRLPVWFSAEKAAKPPNITVTLTYLTPSKNSNDAILEIMDAQGTSLGLVRGVVCWHPTTRSKRNKYGGFDSDSYPHYTYVRANGALEVIEHRKMEPIFRISDEPQLRREAEAATDCDKR